MPAGGFVVRSRAVAAIRGVLRVTGWPARMLLVGLIRAYRLTLASVFGGQCRFHPSCSEYAEGAIRSRGAVVGAALAAWRIARCNPFGRGGIDPAPERLPRLYDSVIPSSGGEAQ